MKLLVEEPIAFFCVLATVLSVQLLQQHREVQPQPTHVIFNALMRAYTINTMVPWPTLHLTNPVANSNGTLVIA